MEWAKSSPNPATLLSAALWSCALHLGRLNRVGSLLHFLDDFRIGHRYEIWMSVGVAADRVALGGNLFHKTGIGCCLPADQEECRLDAMRS